MKKFTLSVLTVCCALSLAGCSTSGSSSDNGAKSLSEGAMPPPQSQTQNTDRSQNTNSTIPNQSAVPNESNSNRPNQPSAPNTSNSNRPNQPSAPNASNSNRPNQPSTPNASNSNKPNQPSAPNASNSNRPNQSTTPNRPSQSTPPTTPNTPSPSSGSYVGNALVTHNLQASDVVVHALQSNTLDSIVIEGKTISLNLPGHELNGFTHTSHSTTEITGVGKQLKHLRLGYYINYIKAPQGEQPAYSFVIGSPTPISDMPTGGTAKYNGYAVVKPIGSGEHAGFIQSYSSFNVDFANKTINGKLDYNGNANDNIHVSGSISGTSFKGTHEGVTTQGNFYGPQAAELGGTFSGPITWKGMKTNATGAFGAAKQ